MHRARCTSFLLMSIAVCLGCTGCLDLIGDVAGGVFSETQGGQGGARPVRAIPGTQTLTKYNSVEVEPVVRSEDGGPIPPGLNDMVRSRLTTALKAPGLFAEGTGPKLVVRVRMTAHWPANGALDKALGGFSEILGKVEFLDEAGGEPLGIYLVRGYSDARFRMEDHHLVDGFAAGVVEIVEEHGKKRKSGD